MGTEDAFGQIYQLVSFALDERSRRLLAGAAATILGRGGIIAVAQACGLERHTVAAGVSDLRDLGASSEVARSVTDQLAASGPARIRRHGGGRKRLADKDAGLLDDLTALVSPGTRGDPESPLLWTAWDIRLAHVR
jgi:hypothetical protein